MRFGLLAGVVFVALVSFLVPAPRVAALECPKSTATYEVGFTGTGTDQVAVIFPDNSGPAATSQPDTIVAKWTFAETIFRVPDGSGTECMDWLRFVTWKGTFHVTVALGGQYSCTFVSNEVYNPQDNTPDPEPVRHTYTAQGEGNFLAFAGSAANCALDSNAYRQTPTKVATLWFGRVGADLPYYPIYGGTDQCIRKCLDEQAGARVPPVRMAFLGAFEGEGVSVPVGPVPIPFPDPN